MHGVHAGGFHSSPRNTHHLSSKVAPGCKEPEVPQPDFQPSSNEDEDASELSADDTDNGEVVEAGGSARRVQQEQRYASPDPQRDAAPGPAVPRDSRSSWTDLDLSVVVALVAPIGNWLTGSDHLKNLFLILLLIIYLHQLIQVPWELYQSARARRPHPTIPVYRSAASNDRVIAEQALAATELRRHELGYLFLSAMSPFVGAWLLRFVLDTLSGVQNISWFSTTLFVLATGIRPWAHLISRLRDRTHTLHDIIHYPSPDAQLIADSKLQAVLNRVERLEREIGTIRRNMVVEERVEEVYEDLSGAIDDIERVVKRQESRAESTRLAQEHRITAVEKGVSRVSQRRRTDVPRLVFGDPHGQTLVKSHSHNYLAHFYFAMFQAVYVLWALLTFNFRYEQSPTSPARSKHLSLTENGKLHHMRSPSRLETIPEDSTEMRDLHQDSESGSSSELADNESPRLPKSSGERDTSTRRRQDYPIHPRTYVDVASDVVTLPYHLAVRTLLAISPPVQRLFS
ncbi:hypothetical protein EWM64_g1592 [Hericium alpestre]|uniref:Uncharacterized protein n=1 Tax=Hericium alpestre TaxID=135208 RepID=A0A4Z0A7F1_9AGAM|nr:hypothetical protein EWM64_g1592 [Hericium alpestre]